VGKPRNGCDYLHISLVNAGGGMWLAAEGHDETLRVNQVGRISLSWIGKADGGRIESVSAPKDVQQIWGQTNGYLIDDSRLATGRLTAP